MPQQSPFRQLLDRRTVIFDGAMGTSIQNSTIDEDAWMDKQGCNELLNRTAPGLITSIHESFLEAGADVIETNSFGANRIVLADYQMEEDSRELNRLSAHLAREAARRYSTPDHPRFVAGSMGPGTKLPSLGHISFDQLYESYREQAEGLLEGGSDLLIVETCQDLLQVKAALIAVKDAVSETGRDIPIIASVTIERSGTMLMGSDPSAVAVSISALGVDLLGINCAVGPDLMGPHLEELRRHYDGRLFCMPNAGLPEMRGGKTVYSLGPEEFASIMGDYIQRFDIAVAGGCCGTTPEYIRQLAEKTEPASRRKSVTRPGSLASLFSSQEIRQEPAPFLIGERANTNGSKKFRRLITEEEHESAADLLLQQAAGGAHATDLCVAYPGRNEEADICSVLALSATRNRLPFVIDSTDPRVIETALKMIGGKPLINSVNLEEGEDHALELFKLAARYGAAIICLTIDEEGMARTVERKLQVARRLAALAEQSGLSPRDLVIDPLTFTLGSGDESLREAGIASLEAIQTIKSALPGIHTVLGLSNISFGLSPAARQILNTIFLQEAVRYGLDMAIVNPAKILPPGEIDEESKKAALELIYHNGDGKALLRFIEHMEGAKAADRSKDSDSGLSPRQLVEKRLISGSSDHLEENLRLLLEKLPAGDIITSVLIPAMGKVGELFGQGEMQLPFVLQSAEVMKRSVAFLQDFMEAGVEQEHRGTVILATVRGDVHDIGKNLVDIILSNNGYKVINLGIKVDINRMIQAAREHKAMAIGMSGLLVKSTAVMKENLQEMKKRELNLPVFLGGAALTPDFVSKECEPIAPDRVFYCRDAFDSLNALDSLLKEGSSAEPQGGETAGALEFPTGHETSGIQADPINTEIQAEELFSIIQFRSLYRGRWGFRQGKMSDHEFQAVLKKHAQPRFESLKELIVQENLLEPRCRYRFIDCEPEGHGVILREDSGKEERLPFANNEKGKQLADSFKQGFIPIQIVSIGTALLERSRRFFQEDRYQDYLFLHGLGVELTEALAEAVHRKIDRQLFPEGGRSRRYSFGYPVCPELEANIILGRLLDAEGLGISFTETGLMVPELSTSAFILPQKKGCTK